MTSVVVNMDQTTVSIRPSPQDWLLIKVAEIVNSPDNSDIASLLSSLPDISRVPKNDVVTILSAAPLCFLDATRLDFVNSVSSVFSLIVNTVLRTRHVQHTHASDIYDLGIALVENNVRSSLSHHSSSTAISVNHDHY